MLRENLLRPKLNKIEIWFWEQMPYDYRHWWIGTCSKLAHCAIVLGDWQLGVHTTGNKWDYIPATHPWYQSPDYIVNCGYTANTYLDFMYLEKDKLKPFSIWWRSCARYGLGFNIDLGTGYCTTTVNNFLCLPKSILTVDDLWEAL